MACEDHVHVGGGNGPGSRGLAYHLPWGYLFFLFALRYSTVGTTYSPLPKMDMKKK